MRFGLIGNIMIISATKKTYNEKDYFSLCVVGADGFADNINCSEDLYNKVMSSDFVKPCMYEVQFEFSSGSSSKGRYSFLRAFAINKKVG